MPLVPHGFQVHVAPEIVCTNAGTAEMPTPPRLFESCRKWDLQDGDFPAAEPAILKGLQVSSQEAIDLEKNTRQQSGSKMRKRARTHRLTASSFGVVVKRPTWTEKGLQNLTADKDLSRVRAVQYGIKSEQPAVQRYMAVMKVKGHDVEAFRRGLVVDPSCPWLRASPDRLLFDQCEIPSHGLLEVKCPYSLKGKTPDGMGDGHCLKKAGPWP
ncbi:uncharacterized protein LOC144094187 [Amblyomma americanum]